MNFEFFAFLVFMSFVSFAVAFLAYGMVVRFMGKDGFLARMGQIILVPACIVIYDFITMAAPQSYRYIIGSIPLVLIAGIAIYFRFVKGENFAEAKEQSPSELARNLPASTKKEEIAVASNLSRNFCAKAEYIT